MVNGLLKAVMQMLQINAAKFSCSKTQIRGKCGTIFAFFLTLSGFLCAHRVCLTAVTGLLQLYFYTIMLTNAKEHRSRKVKSFSFGCFLFFFFIDSIILTCTCVYVLYGRKSKGFVSVYICAIAFQCGIDVLK